MFNNYKQIECEKIRNYVVLASYKFQINVA